MDTIQLSFCRKDWNRISAESSLMSPPPPPDDPIVHGTELNRIVFPVFCTCMYNVSVISVAENVGVADALVVSVKLMKTVCKAQN